MMSVVIPTRDRRPLVLRLLSALARQCVEPGSFDVVVVADGATDDTAETLRSERWPFALQVIEQPQRGPAAARNRGAAAATGAFLVFMDDDMVPRADFLERMRSAFDNGADIVLPITRVADWVPDGLLAWEQRSWVEHGIRVAAAGALTMHDVHFAATGVRRSCFDEQGGFDASFTAGDVWGKEDAELGYRLLRDGGRAVFRSDIIVDMDCVTDPRLALRRARAIGRGDVQLARKHPEMAPQLFRTALREARIQRAMGHVMLAAPWSIALLWPLRWMVIAAVQRAWAGALMYRLWLVVWSAEWWRGVVDAGGRALAWQELRGRTARAGTARAGASRP
jgi:glycosyltransferase involved in cell wall biosynthesis